MKCQVSNSLPAVDLQVPDGSLLHVGTAPNNFAIKHESGRLQSSRWKSLDIECKSEPSHRAEPSWYQDRSVTIMICRYLRYAPVEKKPYLLEQLTSANMAPDRRIFLQHAGHVLLTLRF